MEGGKLQKYNSDLLQKDVKRNNVTRHIKVVLTTGIQKTLASGTCLMRVLYEADSGQRRFQKSICIQSMSGMGQLSLYRRMVFCPLLRFNVRRTESSWRSSLLKRCPLPLFADTKRVALLSNELQRIVTLYSPSCCTNTSRHWRSFSGALPRLTAFIPPLHSESEMQQAVPTASGLDSS